MVYVKWFLLMRRAGIRLPRVSLYPARGSSHAHCNRRDQSEARLRETRCRARSAPTASKGRDRSTAGMSKSVIRGRGRFGAAAVAWRGQVLAGDVALRDDCQDDDDPQDGGEQFCGGGVARCWARELFHSPAAESGTPKFLYSLPTTHVTNGLVGRYLQCVTPGRRTGPTPSFECNGSRALSCSGRFHRWLATDVADL